MSKDLRNRTITGVSWSAVAQAVTQLFTFAISIVLARLLGPKAFGLIGMVTVFTGFAALFSGLGLGAAIIQRKNLEPRHLNTAFWLNLAFGSGLTLLMIVLAPVVAWFYKEPQLTPLTACIAFQFLISSLCVVQSALLSREMRFRALAVVQIGSSVASGSLGLGMAFGGMGVWSLVAQTLTVSATQLLLLWKMAHWRPRLAFEWLACKELFGYSASVLGFDSVNYWARSLDRLLIGRFIGADGLGIYSRAYNLMLLPLSQVSRIVGGVMFPAMSAIQDDRPRVKRAYLKAIGMIGFITFPMMVGLFVLADHFILALLGPEWAATIPILKLFCWVGLIQSILSTVGWIYISLGKTKLYFVMGVIGTVLCLVGFVIGIHWGLMGVVYAYSLTTLIVVYPFFLVPGRLIGLSFMEALSNLSPAFFCSLAMGAVMWGCGRLFPPGTNHWVYLAVLTPLGSAVYLALAAGLKINVWIEARRVFAEALGGRLKLAFVRLQRWLLPKRGTSLD